MIGVEGAPLDGHGNRARWAPMQSIASCPTRPGPLSARPWHACRRRPGHSPRAVDSVGRPSGVSPSPAGMPPGRRSHHKARAGRSTRAPGPGRVPPACAELIWAYWRSCSRQWATAPCQSLAWVGGSLYLRSEFAFASCLHRATSMRLCDSLRADSLFILMSCRPGPR